MRRRLLNVSTALSLLLCVAVVVLWVLSYHMQLDYRHRRDQGFDGRLDRSRLTEVAAFCGGLQAAVIQNHYTPAWTWGSGSFVQRFVQWQELARPPIHNSCSRTRGSDGNSSAFGSSADG